MAHSPPITDDERFLKLYKKLTKAIELLHVDMVSKAIRDLKAELLKGLAEDSWLSGSALKSLVREIVNTYYIILRTNNVRLEDGEAERAAWEEALDHAYSLDLLFAELIKGITASLTRIAEGETKRHAGKSRWPSATLKSTIWRTSLWKISVSTLALTLPTSARFSRKKQAHPLWST